jgi:MFS family permease
MLTAKPQSRPFFGWRVVAGAFVLAVLGWGLGFYGPPVYLHAVREARGWSVGIVSAAVTAHYLCGALVVANLPKLYARFGLKVVTRIGAIALAIGLVGWASAAAPWQLFVATILTGCGWVTMGAAAINAIVSPWFVRLRPKALSTAYNGASVGGIIFSPLWVWLIGAIGFQLAAALVGACTIAIVIWLTATTISLKLADLGQQPDGEAVNAVNAVAVSSSITPLPGPALWRDRRFRTLAIGMALGLFAQIGLLAHLFSLIVPALGSGLAGLVAGAATAAAIAGRTAFGWLMPVGADRRRWAALSYAIQIGGAAILILSSLSNPVLVVLGVLLFGFGIGNATSLPPLIAQVEFAKDDTPRVVALIVALAQATYAFAPAIFGIAREAVGTAGNASEALAVCTLAITVKMLAIAAFLAGRGERRRPH